MHQTLKRLEATDSLLGSSGEVGVEDNFVEMVGSGMGCGTVGGFASGLPVCVSPVSLGG